VVDSRRDEIGLWAYCRKLRSDDEILELYTDAESKLETARRVRVAFWRYVVTSFICVALLGGFMGWYGANWGGLVGGLFGGGLGATVGGIAVWRKVKRIKDSTNTL